MAPNTNNDCSQDILFFRQLISDALSRKLFYFDEGYIPLYRLLIDVPEAQGSKKSKVRKSYSPEEAAAQFPEYRDIIRTFIQYADTDREYVKEFFVWRTCLQFAVIKKEIATLDCDLGEIQPYSKVTPLWKEIASFLAESYWCDRVLTCSFLSEISERMSSLSVLNAVCDNPFLNRKDVQLGQAAAVIEDSFYNLGEGDQKLFAKEIVAYQVALNLGTLNILLNLRSYAWTAKDIALASISPTDFTKFKEKVESLPFGKTAFASYPEGKEEYRKVLDRILATAVEQGQISLEEKKAILGKDMAVSAGEKPSAAEATTINVQRNHEGVGREDTKSIEFFPFMVDAIKEDEVITTIADVAVRFGFLEDDPDMVAAFKYRFTGLEKLKPQGSIKKIHWRMNAIRHKKTHPGELLALLKVFSQSSLLFKENCKHILRFFSFQMIVNDGVYEAVDYSIPKNPNGYVTRTGDDFRSALKDCFHYNENIYCYLR